MNAVLNLKEKKAVPQAIPHSNVLLVQDSQKPFHRHSDLLHPFCQLHVAHTEQEAMELLQEVLHFRLIISDMAMLTAGNFKLLKYLKLNGAYHRLPLVNIMPAPEDPNRFVSFCFNMSDFSLQELQAEEFSTFIKKMLDGEDRQPADHHGVRTSYATGKLLSTEEIKWMNELESLVTLHLSDPSYDTAKMAFDLHLSKSTLSRKIQYLFGINPGQYITRIRMEKALHYLENRHYSSIAQVASAVGFRHAGSFSRCFHQHFGMAPSEI